MTTTIIKKIGTAGAGRDYAGIQAFFDATPASPVAADEQWVGEFYNDSELVCTATQTLAARTTDATRNIILRAATGQGIADNAGKATNALYYNPALGACVKGTLASMPLIQMNADYSEIRGIQFKMTDSSATSILVMQAKNTVAIGNLLQTSTTAISAMAIDVGAGTAGSTVTVEDNIIVMLGGTSIGIHSNYAPGGTIANNTIYSSSANSRYGILLEATGPVVKNNAIFNITNAVSGGGSAVTNNATDQASISSGSGNIVSQTFSNHFVSTVNLRLKSTSTLIGAGVAISGLTQDVLKQTFLTPPAVGAYEYYGAPASISSDLAATYSVIAGVSSDLAPTYNLLGTVSADLAAAYTLLSASAVSNDLAASWSMSAAVSADLAAVYSILASVNNSLNATYNITSPGVYVSDVWMNNTQTLWGAVAVSYTWTVGGRIGSMTGKTIVEGTATLGSDSRLHLSGLPAGAGQLAGSVLGATPAQDAVYLEYGTVV